MPPGDSEGQVIHGFCHRCDTLTCSKIVALTTRVVWIVGRRWFHDTGTKLRIRVFVRNDWISLLAIGRMTFLPIKSLSAWSSGWPPYNVPKHDLRTSCRHFGAREPSSGMVHVVRRHLRRPYGWPRYPERAVRAAGVPVDKLTTIVQPFLYRSTRPCERLFFDKQLRRTVSVKRSRE